jgi:hypothetical protein
MCIGLILPVSVTNPVTNSRLVTGPQVVPSRCPERYGNPEQFERIEAPMDHLPPVVADALARLDGRIAALEERPRDAPTEYSEVPRSICWPELDERSVAAEWRNLGRWVDGLLLRHPMHRRVLRPCWRAHPDVVDELCALRVAWQGAYRSLEPSATAAVDWMTRWLPATMTRIELDFSHSGCKAGREPEHHGPEAHPIATWTPERVERFIGDDLAARRVRPEAT